MEEFNKGPAPERIPAHFESIKMPANFHMTLGRIQTQVDIPEGDWRRVEHGETKTEAVEGFEDVLYEPLGAGTLYYNRFGCITQLALALSMAPNPKTQEILGNPEIPAGGEVIKALRKEVVLSGLRIIDLACGTATFALSAHALGADVYTADAEGLPQTYKNRGIKHLEIDLNDMNAPKILREFTGANFDIVTENAIGTTPLNSRLLQKPKSENIVRTGDVLLKKGGYLYRPGESSRIWLLRKTIG